MSNLTVSLRPPQFNTSPGGNVQFLVDVTHPKPDPGVSHSLEQSEEITITVDGTQIFAQQVRLETRERERLRVGWDVPEDTEANQVAEVVAAADVDDDAEALTIKDGFRHTRIAPTAKDTREDMDPRLRSNRFQYGSNADGTSLVIGTVRNTDPDSPNTDTVELSVDESTESSQEITLAIGETYEVTYSPDITALSEDTPIPVTLSTGDGQSSGNIRVLKSRPFTDGSADALIIVSTEPEEWSEAKIEDATNIGPGSR